MASEEVKWNAEPFVADLTGRVSRLEEGQQRIIERHYEFDKELSNLQIDLKYIREGMDQTKGGINKLLWGIAAVFITYVIGFIVSGGLLTVPIN